MLVILMTIPGLALFYGGLSALQEHAVRPDAGLRDRSR
jgi:ammonia channel protein AmtB